MIFKDSNDDIVDPEALDYKYFIKDQTKTDLLNLAKLAGLSIESNLRKEDLMSLLSVQIPKVAPTLIDKLNSKDRLKCEFIVSSGGYMSAWELFTRMKLESRLKAKSSQASSMSNQGGRDRKYDHIKKYHLSGIEDVEKEKEEKDEEDDEDVEDYDYYLEYRYPFNSYYNYSSSHYYYQSLEQKKPPLSALFIFPKPLMVQSNYVKKGINEDRQVYLIIPKEARRYFKTRILKVDLVASNEIAGDISNTSALQTPELFNLIQTLLEIISSKHPKPTPKAGVIPKALFLPIFKQFVARSEVYKKLHAAEYFGWNDFNELLMKFMYYKGLIRRAIRREGEAERLIVVSSKASQILSSNKALNEAFLDWWASGKSGSSNNNSYFLFKSKIFEFDTKMPKLKSDEIATRNLLYTQIKKEMKAGTWYYTHSILGKCSIESGGTFFKDRGGYSVYVHGPNGVITNHDQIFEEFLSMMLVFPLCLLGILQTNNSKKELMMLGRWVGSPPISVDTAIAGYPDKKSANLVALTVTSNFEVILHPQSPEGRLVTLHLREFCDSITKSDSAGGDAIIDEPLLVFKLSRKSFLRALRTGNYTWQSIISLLARAAGSVDNIPQNVKHELTAWGERYGEVEIKTAEVLKCRDEIIAESLMNDATLRNHIKSRIGNTTIEIKPGSKSKILSRCDKLGFLAKW